MDAHPLPRVFATAVLTRFPLPAAQETKRMLRSIQGEDEDDEDDEHVEDMDSGRKDKAHTPTTLWVDEFAPKKYTGACAVAFLE